jgi:hypothetical protein
MARGILLIFAVLVSPILYAGPIGTYTFTGNASGVLSAASFISRTLTITGTADITTISHNGAFAFSEIDFNPGMATFTIDGTGSETISTLTFVVDNYGTDALIFGGLFGGTGAGGLVFLRGSDIAAASFSNYFLDTSFPAIGPALNRAIEIWGGLPENLPTSAGLLTVTAYDDITFSAVVVPEPATLLIVLIVLVGAWLLQQMRICYLSHNCKRTSDKTIHLRA